jgi:hypothetical protein
MRRIIAALTACLVSGGALAQIVNGGGGGGSGTPGGSAGQIQYNIGGTSFGGFTQGGDCTTDTSTGLITCLLLNGTAPGPFFAVAWPATADGLGSNGSAFLPWTFGTGFVKSGTVWNLTVPLNTQSGNSAYTILSTDAAKTVSRTNTVTQTDPVPQATGSFAAGFGFNYQTATVGNTLTSTTSTINGIAGATGIKVGIQQGSDWFSDGTNWHANLYVPQPATQTGTTILQDNMTWTPKHNVPVSVGWIATVNPNNVVIAVINQASTISAIVGAVETATGGTSTVTVNKAASGTACSAGTVLHSGSFNANGTAATNQTLTLVGGATDNLAIGDRLCLQTTGTTGWTAGVGIGTITVFLAPS